MSICVKKPVSVISVICVFLVVWLFCTLYIWITDRAFKVLITFCSLCRTNLPPGKKLLRKEVWKVKVWSHQQCPFRWPGRPFGWDRDTQGFHCVAPHWPMCDVCEGEWTFKPLYSVHTPGHPDLPSVAQMPPLQFSHYPGCAVTNPHSTNPAHFTHIFILMKLGTGSEVWMHTWKSTAERLKKKKIRGNTFFCFVKYKMWWAHFRKWVLLDQTQWLMMDNCCHLRGSKWWPCSYKRDLTKAKAPGCMCADEKHPNSGGLWFYTITNLCRAQQYLTSPSIPYLPGF